MVVSPHHGRAPFGVPRFGFWRKNSKSILPSVDTTIKTAACFEGAGGLFGACRAPLLFPLDSALWNRSSQHHDQVTPEQSSAPGFYVARPAGYGLIRLCHRQGAQAR